MGFGDTAKKVKQLTAKAEKIYIIAKELQQKVVELKDEIEEIRESMKTLDAEVAAQGDRLDRHQEELVSVRNLVTAIAEENDVDVEAVLANPSEFEFDVDVSETAAASTETGESATSEATDDEDAETGEDAGDTGNVKRGEVVSRVDATAPSRPEAHPDYVEREDSNLSELTAMDILDDT